MRKAAFVFAWLFLAVCCQGRVITVDDDGPADFNNIQAAIDDANDGDEIVIAEGIYTGPGNRDITFQGKRLTVRSTDPNDPNIVAATIIDGQHIGGHRGFTVGLDGEANSVIDGLTVVGFFMDSSGGGIACASVVTIRNCIISGNFAAVHGGGVGIHGAGVGGEDFRLVNCTVTGNSAASGGGVVGGQITGCVISGNTARDMGGGIAGAISVSKSIISGNTAHHLGGGIASAVSVSKSIIIGNFAEYGGGGIFYVPAFGNGFVEDSIISGNTAEYDGGGLLSCLVPVRGCLITGNTSGRDGGGISDCNGPIVNCTITGNQALGKGGGLHCADSYAQVVNSILWGNSGAEGNEIALGLSVQGEPSELQISYSDVKGGYAQAYLDPNCEIHWGLGNVDEDPCFVELGYWDVNGAWVEGDYRLLESSPCINSGDPNYISQPNETDLDGNPRLIGGRIDMGAYEFEFLPAIEAVVRISPKTLNLQSKGRWIMCVIRLPEGYNVADVNSYSILLEEAIEADWIWFDEDQQVVMAKFSRTAVIEMLCEVETPAEVELVVSGELSDGTVFEGTDVIRVIDKGGKKQIGAGVGIKRGR